MGGLCRNSDMHPAQRLSLFRYGSRRNGLEDFIRASGMDSTRDIRTSRGGRLACSTVVPRRERDDRCLSLRRSFSFAPTDPGLERSPFSSVSGLFDLAVGTVTLCFSVTYFTITCQHNNSSGKQPEVFRSPKVSVSKLNTIMQSTT